MKKSFNVNLGGRIFLIDEDAYEQLNDYLLSVKTCFMNNESGEEIAADIEMRLSELFDARVANSERIITLALVNEMVTRVGKPESMIEEDGDGAPNENRGSAGEDGEKVASSDATEEGNKCVSSKKKLFRDESDKILGGVISGLAAYTKCDVTLLRIIAVILFFITAFYFILLYLALWLIIPVAKTTTDKLRMQGVEPTPENIAERIVCDEPEIDKIMNKLKVIDNKNLLTLLKFLTLLLLLSLVATLLSMPTAAGLRFLYITFSWIGWIPLVAIPVMAVVMVITDKWSSYGKSVKIFLFINWVLAFILVVVSLSYRNIW